MSGFPNRAIFGVVSFFIGGAVYFAGGAIFCFMLRILPTFPDSAGDCGLPDSSTRLFDFLNDASAKSERFDANEFRGGVFFLINDALRRAPRGGTSYAVTVPPEFRFDGESLVVLQRFEINSVFLRTSPPVKLYYDQNLSITHAYVGDAKLPGFVARKLNRRLLRDLKLEKIKQIKVSGDSITLYK